MTGAIADRRRSTRHRSTEEHGIISTRVRPGYRAMLINISAGGALLDTTHRLLPGTTVELHVERSTYRASVRGRVLRCGVVRVRPSSVCYRGAICFDRFLPWFVEPERVDVTHQVV
jgi:hypothetical protein